MSVWDLRPVLNQRTAGSARKRKVGDNLYYNEKADEDDQDVDSNWYNYVA